MKDIKKKVEETIDGITSVQEALRGIQEGTNRLANKATYIDPDEIRGALITTFQNIDYIHTVLISIQEIQKFILNTSVKTPPLNTDKLINKLNEFNARIDSLEKKSNVN